MVELVVGEVLTKPGLNGLVWKEKENANSTEFQFQSGALNESSCVEQKLLKKNL